MIEFILIRRAYEQNQTLGILHLVEDTKTLFTCRTLELAWRNNLPQVSCVPAGKYRMVYEHSEKFNRKLWELKDVPGRDEIKFHVANFADQLLGCIAVGDMHLDLNDNGERDLRNSKVTLSRLHDWTRGMNEGTLWIYGNGEDVV